VDAAGFPVQRLDLYKGFCAQIISNHGDLVVVLGSCRFGDIIKVMFQT